MKKIHTNEIITTLKSSRFWLGYDEFYIADVMTLFDKVKPDPARVRNIMGKLEADQEVVRMSEAKYQRKGSGGKWLSAKWRTFDNSELCIPDMLGVVR